MTVLLFHSLAFPRAIFCAKLWLTSIKIFRMSEIDSK